VILLSAVFAAAGWLTFGRRSVARGRRERREARHRDRQSSFARTLQFADSEGDAHALVKRHLERSVPDAAIVVLQRNNSADRLEALTPIEPGTAFAEHLVDAGPRDCLAVRMGQTYEGGTSDDLLSCSLCGKAAAELTTCTPLLVQGEVIGSVLVAHQAPLDEDERIHVDETVTQAAPVIANMRNLAIAEERASTDPLTGLANRRSITDTLRRMLAQADRTGQSMAVLALDLDHFKRINDRLGHDKGDDVLAAAAQAFQSTLRASDFVGRQGGEEFIALLPDTGLAGALSAAENVRAAIHRLEVPGIDLPVSASLGVAVFPEDGLEPEGLLRAADRALYAAKAGGRNRVASAAAPAAEAAQTPA
jgi:diguanylate cyclase (GGDEF)-like protein